MAFHLFHSQSKGRRSYPIQVALLRKPRYGLQPFTEHRSIAYSSRRFKERAKRCEQTRVWILKLHSHAMISPGGTTARQWAARSPRRQTQTSSRSWMWARKAWRPRIRPGCPRIRACIPTDIIRGCTVASETSSSKESMRNSPKARPVTRGLPTSFASLVTREYGTIR